MQKYEYHCLYSGQLSGSELSTELNRLGAEGWQLISVVESFHYLSRPLPKELKVTRFSREGVSTRVIVPPPDLP